MFYIAKKRDESNFLLTISLLSYDIISRYIDFFYGIMYYRNCVKLKEVKK